MKVLETTFQIDSAETAELMLGKTQDLVDERDDLQERLTIEQKRVFDTKQKLMFTRSELEKAESQVAKLTTELEESEQYRDRADERRREVEAINKELATRNKELEEELRLTCKQRDKQKRKVRHREKALSKLEALLQKTMGEVEVLRRQKGREHEMVRKMSNKYATMEAKVLRVEKEKSLLQEYFEGEMGSVSRSAAQAAAQQRLLLDSAQMTIADYKVQVHDWQRKELERKPDGISDAVRKIGIHATNFLRAIDDEGRDGDGDNQNPRKPVDIRRRWKSLRLQVQEMREMAYGMLTGATKAVKQRSTREVELEKEVTKWKISTKAARAELGRERVLTKMLRRIFDPTKAEMRATLHISGTKREKIYKCLDKNKTWDINRGTTFTLTCCKHCGKFFIEEDAEWPFPCEIADEHEMLEEIVDVTSL